MRKRKKKHTPNGLGNRTEAKIADNIYKKV